LNLLVISVTIARVSRLAGLVTLVAVALIVASEAAAAPKTLVRTAEPISEVRHDGDRILWTTGPCYKPIWIRNLHRRSTRVFPKIAGCDYYLDVEEPWALTLAGTRVVWANGFVSEMDNFYGTVYTAALSEGRASRVASLDYFSWGPQLGPTAGDGKTLVYSLRFEERDSEGARTLEGGVKRINGRSSTYLPGVPPATLLAAASGRIALIPATVDNLYLPPENSPVEIRDAATGALIANFTPPGRVRELVLSRTVAAVVVADAGDNVRIERYSIPNGSLLGTTHMSSGWWNGRNRLDVSEHRIVYSTGQAIRLLNALSGAKKLLWRTSVRPFHVSIEGRRVAWAINGRRGGRILAITLPRSP
jgi:hypothetical protein